MPAVSVSDLRDEWLFRARNLYTPATNYEAQRAYLWAQYQALTAEGDAEGTSTSADGSAAAFQWRGATPEEKRMALKTAIEKLEGLIGGDVASQFSKPFGFKFVGTPHETFDGPGSSGISL